MQGRENQESGSFERPSPQGFPSLNGTNKHRAVLRNPNEGTSKHKAIQEAISQKTSEIRALPKRPEGMARIDTPPETIRVPRPMHHEPAPQKLRKRILMFGGTFLILAIIAGLVGYFLASGMFASAPASTTAADFLNALNTKDYAQAYKDLGPAITIRTSQDQFINQARVLDTCYGQVQDYKEIADSAQVTDTSQTYFYTISRIKNKATVSYKLQITLQKDMDDGTWKVTDYSNNMGPGQPVPACTK